jgi:hypothetical protein
LLGVDEVGVGVGMEDMAGGKIGEEFEGEDGVDVGDVGLVWGEKVIEGGEGGSRVVEVVIWTISVSIYGRC